MADPNPVIQHLEEQDKRSTAMIAPWLRDLSSQKSSSDNPPTHDASSKTSFLLSVQNLNFFNKKKHALVQPQNINSFVNIVAKKYEGVKEMIPLSKKLSLEKGEWRELERVFPTTAGFSNAEEPLQPGELRSGSIIQKFVPPVKSDKTSSTANKSNEQTQERQHQKEFISKNSPSTAGQRLFSKVVEITPKIQPEDELLNIRSENELSMNIPENIESESKNPTADEAATSKADIVQADDNTIKKESSDSISPSIVPPIGKHSAKSLTQKANANKPEIEMPLNKLPEKVEKASVRPEEKKEIRSDITTGDQPFEKAAFSKKTDLLLKAIPVKRADTKPAEVLKAIPSKIAAEKNNLPVSSHTPSLSKTVQRSPELPLEQNDQESPSIEGSELPTRQEMQEAPVQIASDKGSDISGENQEMPLKTIIDNRKNYSEELRSSSARINTKLIPPTSIVNRQSMPLVSPNKYYFEKEPKNYLNENNNQEKAGDSIKVQTFDFVDRHSINIPNKSEFPSVEQKQNYSSFVDEKKPVFQPQQVLPQPVNRAPIDIVYTDRPKQSAVKAANSTPGSGSTGGNIVQREMNSNSTEASQSSAPETDFAKLAEDVFPFVKRLIEAETERSRGSFR